MEIYFDNSATTCASPEVIDIMVKCLGENYGNPSSLHHKGFVAEKAVNKAREQVAASLNCRPDEVFFTSCGTESNNLALLGCAEAYKRKGNRVVVSMIEHSSIIEAAKELERRGFDVRYVAPQKEGKIDPEDVAREVNEDTILVSVMRVNSETGAINDIPAISAACKRENPNVIIHTDCVQAYGKMKINPVKMGADIVTVSGHKIHASKGIAAIYRRKGVRLIPLYFGSAQEKGMHSGTENVPGMCGMGAAAENMYANLSENYKHYEELHDYLVEKLKAMDEIYLNSPEDGLPCIVNMSVMGIRSEILIHFLEQYEIYVSSGSACSKGAKSHVLTAMGLSDARIDSALRVTFNENNTKEEIDFFCEKLEEAQKKVKRAVK